MGADPVAMLAEASGTQQITGARGAAGYEMLRRTFARTPGLYAALVRRSIQVSEERFPGDPEATQSSAWDFVHHQFQLGNQTTLTYCALGFAHILDQCRSRRWDLVEDAASRLLVATEQAALDHSQWQIAWKLTFLREPQWALIHHNQATESKQFGLLADPAWIATTIAYMKDMASVEEIRKKNAKKPKGGGRGKKDEDE